MLTQAQKLTQDSQKAHDNVMSLNAEILNIHRSNIDNIRFYKEMHLINIQNIKSKNNDVKLILKKLMEERISMHPKLIDLIVLSSKVYGFTCIYREIFKNFPNNRISHIIGKFRILKNDRRQLHRMRYQYALEYIAKNGGDLNDPRFQLLS